jgi:hypothetical protein
MLNYFRYPVSRKQCIETGLVMILFSLVAGITLGKQVFQAISIGLVLVIILLPMAFYPLAIVWFGFSRLLGAVTSRVLLYLIFFVIVTPVAVIRRMAGKDRLGLKDFKKGNATAFTVRSHKYLPEDLVQPF